MPFFEAYANSNRKNLLAKNSSKYLLNSSIWASGLVGPAKALVHGSHMYIANYGDGTISQLSLADGSIIKADWATGLYGPLGMVVHDAYLYVSNFGLGFGTGTSISQVSLADGSITNLNWATGLEGSPAGLAVYGLHMYVANFGFEGSTGSTSSQISLLDGSITKSDWATGLDAPLDLLIDGTYMYVSNFLSGTISKVSLVDGSITKSDWTAGLAQPGGLAVYETYMYVANFGNGTISKIKRSDGSIVTLDWASGFESPPLFLLSYEAYLYASIINETTIIRLELITPTPTPIINICFPAGTPVTTDQGNISIENVDPNKHTINNKPIVKITKTISTDKYLICFKKNSLG